MRSKRNITKASSAPPRIMHSRANFVPIAEIVDKDDTPPEDANAVEKNTKKSDVNDDNEDEDDDDNDNNATVDSFLLEIGKERNVIVWEYDHRCVVAVVAKNRASVLSGQVGETKFSATIQRFVCSMLGSSPAVL